jgi:hypothetical protein
MTQIEAAAAVLHLAQAEEQIAERRHISASEASADAYRLLMEARRVRVLAEQRLAQVSALVAA